VITGSAFGKGALGAAAGFSVAFAATRAVQALRDLRSADTIADIRGIPRRTRRAPDAEVVAS